MHDIASGKFNQLPLLSLPTSQLLDKFGSGGHKPGSGSAAALMGVVACKLLRTVISLTRSRDQYKENLNQLSLVDKRVIDRIEPFLLEAVQKDAVAFDEVIRARRVRDDCKDPEERKRLGRKVLDRLRIATDIPMEIADYCINLTDQGFTVFDLGFKSARGDSGVAMNAAISGSLGALFIVYLNLSLFKEGEWARNTRAKADAMLTRAQSQQTDVFKRVSILQTLNVIDSQIPLGLGLMP